MTNKKLFGTSGIRGKIGSEINSELALKIGKSLAKYLNNTGKVVIGYDTRTTNRMLEQAITAGLIEHGVDVVKIGMVPTPLVGYATLKLDGDAGIMLTASHNPSQYNGILTIHHNTMELSFGIKMEWLTLQNRKKKSKRFIIMKTSAKWNGIK